MTKIRTRFAPSPTGRMHVGNLRTALYAYLITKHEGGDFILRIEDTDQERYVEGAVDIIYRTMEKTGLIHDEGPDKDGGYGPYVQSERQAQGIYMKYARQLVDKIKKAVPDISLTTDIIVGFPGETEEDFRETLDVVRKVRYDSAFTFIYSKRTGTPAAVMEDQVSEAEVKDRFDRLLKEVQTISAQRCAIHEGTIQKALVECQNEHDPSLVTGRLSNNLLVHFPGDPSLIGRLVDVSLDECKGFYYMGKMKDTE